MVGLVLVAAVAAGCSTDPAEPVTTDRRGEDGQPAYCAGEGGRDAGFWDLVHATCTAAQDGDVEQAAALREALGQLPAEDVADFHRTFVRLNRALVPARRVADAICAPGLGLGRELGTDYRSWVIAHGQAAYEAVVADPQLLRDFPDAELGCGRGEPIGDAALEVYLEKTGLDADESGLPTLER
ncbi:hypothetical protein NOCA1220006 [metagenome]|uniref:DUF4240 domain-containing protein n=1 Tax=metagenome TaxID=256318 RepID=A0A2P2CFH5_9ZZZZ